MFIKSYYKPGTLDVFIFWTQPLCVELEQYCVPVLHSFSRCCRLLKWKASSRSYIYDMDKLHLSKGKRIPGPVFSPLTALLIWKAPPRRRGGQTPCNYLCFHTCRSPKSWRHTCYTCGLLFEDLMGPLDFCPTPISHFSSTGHYFGTPPGSWCSYWVLLSDPALSTLLFWVQIIPSLYPPVSFPYHTFWCLTF